MKSSLRSSASVDAKNGPSRNGNSPEFFPTASSVSSALPSSKQAVLSPVENPYNYLSNKFQTRFVNSALLSELEALEIYSKIKRGIKPSTEKDAPLSQHDPDYNFTGPQTAINQPPIPLEQSSDASISIDPFKEYEKKSPAVISELALQKILLIQQNAFYSFEQWVDKEKLTNEDKKNIQDLTSFAKGQIANEVCLAIEAMKTSFNTQKMVANKLPLLDLFMIIDKFCDEVIAIDKSIQNKFVQRSSRIQSQLATIKHKCQEYLKYLHTAVDIHIYLVELPHKLQGSKITLSSSSTKERLTPRIASCISPSLSLPNLLLPDPLPSESILSSHVDIPKECFIGEFTVARDKWHNRYLNLQFKPKPNARSGIGFPYIVFEGLPPEVIYANGTNHMLDNRNRDNPHGHTFLLEWKEEYNIVDDVWGTNAMYKTIAAFVDSYLDGKRYDKTGGWRNNHDWTTQQRSQLIAARLNNLNSQQTQQSTSDKSMRNTPHKP